MSIHEQLKVLERRLDRAKQERQQALDSLKNRDGSAIFSPAEESRRRDEAESEFWQAQSTINAELSELIQQSEEIVRASGQADPLTRLDRDELTLAALLHPFVREDFDVLPTDQIIEHIDAAVRAGDRVRAALMVRAGRLAMYGRFAVQTDDIDFVRAEKGDAIRRLQPALDRAAEIVIDVQARDEALEMIQQARALQSRDVADGFIARTYSTR